MPRHILSVLRTLISWIRTDSTNKAHYTTPQDLAAIMQAALKNKTFVKIFSTISYTIPKTNKSKKRVLWNNHRMIRTKYYYYPGVIGGKSGYITKSRFNLVTVCRKKGMHLIVAVMHGSTAEDMVKDTKKLLDYYYDHYHAVTVPVQASGISVAGIKNVKTSLSGGSLSVIVLKIRVKRQPEDGSPHQTHAASHR